MNSEDIINLQRNSLLAFGVFTIPNFQAPKHIRVIAEHLEALERREITRLIISMPPRHGKTQLASKLFPAWYLGRNPTESVLSLCYSQTLADEFGKDVKSYVDSQNYKTVFPKSHKRYDSDSMRMFTLYQGGRYNSIGRDGSVTGKGGNIIIIDDLIKNRREYNSPVIMKNIKELYRSAFRTRLESISPERPGCICVVMTRWGKNDFTGFLLEETAHENWVELSLPAVCHQENDPLGRKIGEALWPERYPIEELEKIRLSDETGGSKNWLTLYQQMPLDDETSLVDMSKIKYYTHIEHNTLHNMIYVHSWDLTFGGVGDDNSYVVGQVWGVCGEKCYLIYMSRSQTGFLENINVIRSLIAMYPTNYVIIENKADGPATIAALDREFHGKIIPEKVSRSKVDRLIGCLPKIERGEVYLPDPTITYWVQPLIDELKSFPSGTHNDCVDSMTQALNFILKNKITGAFEKSIDYIPHQMIRTPNRLTNFDFHSPLISYADPFR